jgi:hypothetical protein
MLSRLRLAIQLPFLVLICLDVSAQVRMNSISYPYGGENEYVHLIFRDDARFDHRTFRGTAAFVNAIFQRRVTFYDTKFDTLASFRSAQFIGVTNFSESHFRENADFTRAHLDSISIFDSGVFDGTVDFASARFSQAASFDGVIFNRQPRFEGASFGINLNLASVRFVEGVDLRKSHLDSTIVIFDDRTSFPDGKLYVDWEQLKGRLWLTLKDERAYQSFVMSFPGSDRNPLFSAATIDTAHQEVYRSFENFYRKLRDNYQTQHELSSADAVMYELGSKRVELLHEFHWKLYGWLLGWGYQPWRFLLFVVLPFILIFAVIWYWFYYGLVVKIVDDKWKEKYNPGTAPRFPSIETDGPAVIRKLFPSFQMRWYDHAKKATGSSKLLQYWHAIFFSASVLLGIRFKNKWIQLEDPTPALGKKSFLTLITIEWLLGISLYVLFALLVKGSRFEFIKGLLGF